MRLSLQTKNIFLNFCKCPARLTLSIVEDIFILFWNIWNNIVLKTAIHTKKPWKNNNNSNNNLLILRHENLLKLIKQWIYGEFMDYDEYIYLFNYTTV